MTRFKAFVIYDTLYEEYQLPFFMKNENIARVEFDMFVRSQVDKVPEKEKAKTAQRFHLYTFDLDFEQDGGYFSVCGNNVVPFFKIEAEPVAQGVSEDV